jgi:hypothetical protein
MKMRDNLADIGRLIISEDHKFCLIKKKKAMETESTFLIPARKTRRVPRINNSASNCVKNHFSADSAKDCSLTLFTRPIELGVGGFG